MHFRGVCYKEQTVQRVSITKINWLTLFREIIAVYSENNTKHINTLCGQNAVLLNARWYILLPLCFERLSLFL
jgi:hypothetical protein